jgi:hypothetical protein
MIFLVSMSWFPSDLFIWFNFASSRTICSLRLD